MKIQKKHEMKVTMATMVFTMTFILTLVSTFKNFGYTEGFFLQWMKTWGFSFVVALPVVMMVMPPIKKLVAKFIKE